jgi:hypothetical protein
VVKFCSHTISSIEEHVIQIDPISELGLKVLKFGKKKKKGARTRTKELKNWKNGALILT